MYIVYQDSVFLRKFKIYSVSFFFVEKFLCVLFIMNTCVIWVWFMFLAELMGFSDYIPPFAGASPQQAHTGIN